MRRQVKPFVTEYRGTPRRAKDQSGDHAPDAQAPRNRTFAEAEKMFHSETVDNSYEAALRAADALFNAPHREVEPARDASGSKSRQEPGPSRSELTFVVGDDVAEEEASVPLNSEAGDRDAPVSSRRILQAIELPTEDRFAVLEAERAPKRRGRKPGSKNKPKIVVVGDDWGAPARAIPTRSTFVESAGPSAPVPVRDYKPVFAEPEPVDVVDPVGGDETLPQPRARNDKFGWKRAGLRPGERWKRRLPKAAW